MPCYVLGHHFAYTIRRMAYCYRAYIVWSVRLLDTLMSCAKTAEPIWMLFGVGTEGARNHLLKKEPRSPGERVKLGDDVAHATVIVATRLCWHTMHTDARTLVGYTV